MILGVVLVLLVASGSALGMFRSDVVTSAAIGRALPAGADTAVIPEPITAV